MIRRILIGLAGTLAGAWLNEWLSRDTLKQEGVCPTCGRGVDE